MKCYKMPERDMAKGVCWKYALACILGIKPSKVPNFVTEKSRDDIDRTRKWLRKKFKKSIVYIPVNQFMESENNHRNNALGGPDGYSIIIIGLRNDDKIEHAAIAKDGKFFFNSCDNDHHDFSNPVGFYIIYDL